MMGIEIEGRCRGIRGWVQIRRVAVGGIAG